ncbi:N-acetylmuramoyl-L-alanine amidase [Oceanobacillus luteolus]|uniref:N-acetylmuramoyl-L-alanine amidase n=1 Tax=Oceanobacillus luteolus TaxID=1274358 RepID=A0ABW4HV48_9BACI|nr:N-acetylmuramoyl-L-alanine amidase [Oceanobacillus luteolus]MCM3741947.1 N-acetylmuramoyl-L-alanine amidase [Oceanobacillus luteolus]
MKTSLKITFFTALIGLIVFFLLISDSESQQENSDVKHKTDVEQIEEIEATEMHLPLRNSEKRSKPITHVVLHFTSNVTGNPLDPYQLDDIYQIFVDYGVSAHYIIDREGEIFELVKPNRIAYHAGTGSLAQFPEYENQLNAYSIGIELLAIGTKEEMAEFLDEDSYHSLDPSHIGYTDAQYASLGELLEYLYKVYPEIKKNREHVIGHDEYAPERKSDPGTLFDWTKISY